MCEFEQICSNSMEAVDNLRWTYRNKYYSPCIIKTESLEQESE